MGCSEVAGQWEALGKQARSASGEKLRARATTRERDFERLYRESYAIVYNYVCYRMAGDGAVEDIVAEAFLRAARSFDKFDPSRAKFSTWVTTIASNCMYDYWRRTRPTSVLDEVPSDFLAQPDSTDALADRDLVGRLLSVLSHEEREMVVLKYHEGLRNVDIAAKLGKNASTVSTKLANALAKMRSAAVAQGYYGKH